VSDEWHQPGSGRRVEPSDAFGFAWAEFSKVPVVWIVISAIVFAVQAIFGGFGAFADSRVTQVILQILGFLLVQLVSLGLVRASLVAADGGEAEVGQLFQADHLAQYVIASVIYSVIVGLGLVLFILPGILAAIFLAFYGYFILDRDENAGEALMSSFELVRANFANVAFVLVLAFFVYLLGICACFVGVLVTAPLAWLMRAYTYRALTGRPAVAGP